ncbi:MAG: hypothetical protein ACXIU8_02275 [Alkalilacustris sp.]
MSERLTGYPCLTLAMMTVGATVTASKIIAVGMAPFTATPLQFAVALPVFGVAAFGLAVRPALPRLSAMIWGVPLVRAGAGSFGDTGLLSAGLSHMPSTDAGVLIGAGTGLFSALVPGERPGRALGGAGAGRSGGGAVTWSGASRIGLGAALVMEIVTRESVFILLKKCFGTPLSPLWQATVMTGLGVLVAAPFAAPEGQPAAPEALGAAVFHALVPKVGGVPPRHAGAARVSGAEAAFYTAAARVTAVAIVAIWLGEAVGPAQIAAWPQPFSPSC